MADGNPKTRGTRPALSAANRRWYAANPGAGQRRIANAREAYAVAPRCGRIKRNGQPCRRVVKVAGQRCTTHGNGQRPSTNNRARIWRERWPLIRAARPAFASDPIWLACETGGLATARWRMAAAHHAGDPIALAAARESAAATVRRVDAEKGRNLATIYGL